MITDFDREGTGSRGARSWARSTGSDGRASASTGLAMKPGRRVSTSPWVASWRVPGRTDARRVREFMVANPGEVVTGDRLHPSRGLARLFQDAGLVTRRRIAHWPVPTLRQLIDWGSGSSCSVNRGPGPRLVPAWRRCRKRPTRSNTSRFFGAQSWSRTALFFQINNWIETTPAPRPPNAETSTRTARSLRGALVPRGAGGCQHRRRRLYDVEICSQSFAP